MKHQLLEPVLAAAPPAALQILLLFDRHDDALQIIQELEHAGLPAEGTIISTREEFESSLQTGEFAAVLAAYRLPRWSGVEAAQLLYKAGRDVPFLLLTEASEEDEAAAASLLGARDHIFRDHVAKLPLALQRAIDDKRLRDSNTRILAALAQSEARSRELAETSLYGIFRASPDGGILSVNPAMLKLTAYNDLNELQTQKLSSDVFRYPGQWAQLLGSCRDHGLVHNAESEWRRKDGGLIRVRLHLRTLSLPGGAEALEGVVEDITELRLLEDQLQQAQKFESIGQLAGGIAHDFNNVLGAILGWAELGCEKSRATPGISQYFANIRAQADRAATLTRELLTFARRQPLQTGPVDLNSVTGKLANFLEKVIGKDIEMIVEPGGLRNVKADPGQIEQLLMNLCLNARDAMPSGGKLTIATEMADLDESYCRFYPHVHPGNYAVLSVGDTGAGMDAQTKERIFEPFFTTKENGLGTGMGLATAYGIAKQHGGFIHVYSEPGQGSLFRVYFPTMEDGPGVSTADGSMAPGEPAAASRLRGTETILLAEDHDSIREMVRQALLSLGYHVLSAPDGEQALRLCEWETPHLAILDVVMPRLGGVETASRLLERFPKLQILFTSGYAERKDGFNPKVPASQYLQKPYSPTALGKAVRRLIDQAATAAV